MLNFDERTGPDTGVNYPDTPVPQWYRDAKIGVMIHWGIYSIPAWAVTSDEHFSAAEEYAFHRYAEWYGNTVRIPGSPTALLHRARYGQRSYEELLELWHIREGAVADMVDLAAQAGARYVVPTTKHHDGLCLWRTQTTSFSTATQGPGVDLIEQFAHEVRRAGLRLGLYFSGALDWHVSDFGPITSDQELFDFRRNDRAFSQYAGEQLRELIELYSPDYLWNDIDWPDGGKDDQSYSLAAIFRDYFAAVPDGLINDRWGVPAQGVLTREYREVSTVMDRPWEAVRGLGRSFGYNRDESDSHMLSGPDVVRFMVDAVAKNGNLLINIGPQADGTIPESQRQSLNYLGRWLQVFGEAIYGSRPWGPGVIDGRYFTQPAQGASDQSPAAASTQPPVVYMIQEPTRPVELPPALAGYQVTWLDSADSSTTPPAPLADQRSAWPLHVARLERVD